MRDLELGRLVRAVRRQRGWRQLDCAAAAEVHRSTWSRLELGNLDRLSLATLRACLAVVAVRLELAPRWRGGEADRLMDEDHAAMTAALHRRLDRWRWLVKEEVSFNHYGDRGRVDLLAFHPATRTLLIVEVKTEIADAQKLLGSLDVKRRLAPVLARMAGWPQPATVAVLLLVAESSTNRRRVQRLAPLFSGFRRRGRSALGWLRRPTPPSEPMLIFTDLSSAHGGHVRRVGPTRIRRRRPPPSVDEPMQPRDADPRHA